MSESHHLRDFVGLMNQGWKVPEDFKKLLLFVNNLSRNHWHWDHTNPLILAVELGRRDLVELCIHYGISVNAVQLGIKGHTKTALMTAVMDKEVDIARLLIKKGADVNQKCQLVDNAVGHETTPLLHAVFNEDLFMVKLLLQNKANHFISSYETIDGQPADLTPLQLAQKFKSKDITHILEKLG